MRSLRSLSFRKKLTLLLTAAILLPMLVSSMLLGELLRRQLQENYASRLSADLSVLSLILEQKQQELHHSLIGVANDNTLQVTLELQITSQLGHYLEQQAEVYGFSALQIFDPESAGIAGLGSLPSGCINADRVGLLQVAGEGHLCGRVPVLRYGELLGHAVGSTSFADAGLSRKLDDALSDNYLVLLDGEAVLGNIPDLESVYRPQLPPPGLAGPARIGGTEYQVFSQIKENGAHRLQCATLVPLASYHQSLLWTAGLICGAGLLLFGIAILLLRWQVRDLVAPVLRLKQAAARLQQGDYHDLELECQREDEFGLLNRTFVGMAESQRDYADRMEQLVADRTLELSAANSALRDDILARQKAERENERLESQLRQAQKMKALGTMAGGIAHDFNNILMPILCYADLAQKRLPVGDVGRSHLAEISRAGLRARDLVSQILSFSRQDKPKRKLISVDEVVAEAMKLVRASTPAGVRIELNPCEVAGSVLADSTQLHQLILNLGTNAVQAMGDRGVLHVSLTRVADPAMLVRAFRLKGDDFIMLEVRDSGGGMDKETLDRIFEPFFTTKEVGQGTGMGLSVVHGIVEAHDGAIKVESEVGEGTSVKVFLPLAEAETFCPTEEVADLPTGSELILVVDDEPAIAGAWQIILEELGYRAQIAESPAAVLKILAESEGGPDLLITDQNMPEMTGAELTVKALALRPELPIILCTGYSSTVTAADVECLGIRKYLQKPCSIADLAGAVREVLDQSKPAPEGVEKKPGRPSQQDLDKASGIVYT